METLEHLRRQRATLTDLAGVVRTMKALAAVNMREYERAVRALGEFDATVQRALDAALRDLPPPAAARPAAPRRAAVVFGSDHGLCGRFNEDLGAHVRAWIGAQPNPEPPLALAVGARARGVLAGSGLEFTAEIRTPGSAAAVTATVRRMLLEIERWQREHGIERVDLLYNRPVAGSRYRPAELPLLPVDLSVLRHRARGPWPSRSLPLTTLPLDTLLPALLRQYFFVSLARAAAESLAAENASRWAAMQLADNNLSERRRSLEMQYLRRRQDVITSELLEVVSGYEATSTRRVAGPGAFDAAG